MLESKELELQSRLTLGTLESNAEAIRQIVLKHLEDYTPENYIGRADEAKADKALLNKAEKSLNAKRLELECEYMAPFNKFKITITETCKAIKAASAALGLEIKPEKTEALEEYALVFTLTRSQFLDLRGYMSDHGITYSELQDKGSGVYTK